MLIFIFYWDIVDFQYYLCFRYKTVIHNFLQLYSIYSYYKILIYSLCCTIYPCNLFILYIAVCISESLTPILLLLPSFFPLITTGLLYIMWVCFFFVLFKCVSFFSFYRFICLSLIYFIKRNTLQVHPCCCKWQSLILFYE